MSGKIQLNISKLVVAVRGIAIHGPISKYTKDMNKMANGFEIVDNMLFPSLNFERIIIANIGTMTEVQINPRRAKGVLAAACTPKKGAKIKFPAPKNIEKSMRPTQNILLKGILFFMTS